MAALANTSFEVVGASTGLASSWTASEQSSVQVLAGVENFESGWSANEDCALTSGTSAGTLESFASGWSANESYSAVTLGAGAASGAESFETGWSNNDYSSTTTSRHAGTVETFASGWKSNQDIQATFSPSDLAVATVVDFENVVLDHFFYVTGAPTQVITAPGHAYVNGTVLYAQTTNTLPAGLPLDTKLYVVSAVLGVNFKLSLTLGGSAITVTDAGTGDHNVTGDPALYWTTSLE